MMFTPRRPVKRKLIFTPATPKRPKTAAARLKPFNRRYVSGPATGGTLTQQVKSLQRVIKGILPELKNATIDLAQANFGTGGTIQHISAVAQGVTEVSRVGEDMTVKSISLKGYLSNWAAVGAVTPYYYRFVLVTDKQQVNDTVPAVTDIFGSADPVLALPTISYLDRFRILWYSPLMMNYAFGSGNQFPVCEHTWNGNIKVGFNGAAAGDIQKNGIYFVILTSDSGGTVDFTGSARVVFSDT